MLAVIFLNNMISRRRNACKMANEVKTETNITNLEHCRTCLCTENLVALFTSKESERKRSRDLFIITGLDIKLNDGLSQKICMKCIKSLEAAVKFRRLSRKAYKSLCKLSSNIKSKPAAVENPESEIPVQRVAEAKIEEVGNGEYECDVFGDDFQNDQDYNVEVEINPKKIKQKAVKPPVQKKQRMDIPNASSYKCNWCSKEFRMKATFKAHMRFHTNYCVCEACGKRCRNNNQLQEHKRARHGLGKIHKCAYCEYSSATKEALTIHERRHTGERPYICDHCGAAFHRRSNLVQHIAIHLPDKNFQCPICQKWQKSHKLLQVHKYKMHRANRYRYICPVCGMSFTRPGNVRQHLLRGHGVTRGEQGAIQKIVISSTGAENLPETTSLNMTVL